MVVIQTSNELGLFTEREDAEKGDVANSLVEG
jgi:hypothetical protein